MVALNTFTEENIQQKHESNLNWTKTPRNLTKLDEHHEVLKLTLCLKFGHTGYYVTYLLNTFRDYFT